MNILQKLLRARRQSDAFKFALILFGLAGYFIWAGVMQVAAFTAAVNSPTEYILGSSYTGAVLDAGIAKIREMENVTAVSRQREYTITAGDKALTVTELERAYLTGAYGLSEDSLTGFWLSPAAYRSFVGSSEFSSRINFEADGKPLAAVFARTEALPTDLLAVTCGATLTLKESSTLRVMLETSDFSGATLASLETLGFHPVNQEQITVKNYETQLLLTRLEYRLIAAVLALIAGGALTKIAKMQMTPP